MQTSNREVSFNLGVSPLLLAALLSGLLAWGKVGGVLDLSWWWVAAPLLFCACLSLVMACLAVFVFGSFAAIAASCTGRRK